MIADIIGEMPSSVAEVAELRLADVTTFLAVVRTGSVTATARELRVTPSQVSKAIARLEKYVRRPLLTRTSRGVTATDQGRELVPRLRELVESARVLPERASSEELLTVAAPSYLSTTLVPLMAEGLEGSRLRTVEGGDAFIRAYAGDDLFQIAVTLSPQTLTRAWSSSKVGSVRQSFFASPEIAAKIGTTVTREKLRRFPFVMPIYQSGGQLLPGEDGCPIARDERTAGHEVPTVAVALEIATLTKQIAYGPEIAARAHVRDGRLVEIQLQGEKRSVDVYLHVNQDRVLARTRTKIIDSLAAALDPMIRVEEPAKKRRSR